jgi:hypothetical protein
MYSQVSKANLGHGAEVGIWAGMKDNCRSFVAALLWMTSVFVGGAMTNVFVSVGQMTANPAIMNSQIPEARPGVPGTGPGLKPTSSLCFLGTTEVVP